MRRQLIGLTLAVAAALPPVSARAQEDDAFVSTLRPTLPETPAAADTSLLDPGGEPVDSTATDPQTDALPQLRPTLAPPLRTVVRPVPPAQSAVLPAVKASLPTVDREGDARAEYEPLGLRLGSTIVNASFGTGIGYRRHSLDGDETFIRSTGAITARTDWERNSLAVDVSGALRRSLSGVVETLPEASAGLSGRFDVSDRDRLTGSLGWTLREGDADGSHENTWSGTLGYERFGGLVGLRTSLGVDRSVDDSDGGVDNTALSGSLRLSLDSGAVLTPFVEVAAFGRRFDRVAGDGLSRDGIGGEAKVGLTISSDIVSGEVALGYGHEHLEAAGLADISGLIGSASLTWDATELMRLTAVGSSSFDPSSTAGVSGVVKHSGEVTVTYALAPNAYVLSGAGLSFEDHVGSSTEVTTTTLKAGVGYKFNRSVEIGLDGEHKIVRSTAAGGDYTDSSVTASLTLSR